MLVPDTSVADLNLPRLSIISSKFWFTPITYDSYDMVIVFAVYIFLVIISEDIFETESRRFGLTFYDSS
jgi:hypothetical protein